MEPIAGISEIGRDPGTRENLDDTVAYQLSIAVLCCLLEVLLDQVLRHPLSDIFDRWLITLHKRQPHN